MPTMNCQFQVSQIVEGQTADYCVRFPPLAVRYGIESRDLNHVGIHISPFRFDALQESYDTPASVILRWTSPHETQDLAQPDMVDQGIAPNGSDFPGKEPVPLGLPQSEALIARNFRYEDLGYTNIFRLWKCRKQ